MGTRRLERGRATLSLLASHQNPPPMGARPGMLLAEVYHAREKVIYITLRQSYLGFSFNSGLAIL